MRNCKFLYAILKKQSGFTLAEVMIAAGLLGIVSLGAMHLFGNMNKSKTDMQGRFDLMAIKATVDRALSDSYYCSKVLLGEKEEELYLDRIGNEKLPNDQETSVELRNKYPVSGIIMFSETLLAKGKDMGSFEIGEIVIDKMLEGSDPNRNKYRLNLNAKINDKKTKTNRNELNWPIEFRVDPDEDNRVVKCQLHFIDKPGFDNSTTGCAKLGTDSKGVATGLCPRGEAGGFFVTKISGSGSNDMGTKRSWRRTLFASDYSVHGCAMLDIGYDNNDFLTGLCWGQGGIWLIKAEGTTKEEKEEVLASIKLTHKEKNKFILGCMGILDDKDSEAQTGICWGEGLYLIKTGHGKSGIDATWNIKAHLTDVHFTSCVNLGPQLSVLKKRTEINLNCDGGPAGIALVKITPFNSAEGDFGTQLSWHAVLHD